MKEATMMNKLLIHMRRYILRITKHADAYTLGVPDYSFTSEGHSGWIEAKEVKNKHKGRIHFESGQPSFMKSEFTAGGNPYVLANWSRNDGFYLMLIPYEEIYTCFGLETDIEVDVDILQEMSVLFYKSEKKNGMTKEEWEGFAEKLIGVMRNEIVA